MDTIKCYGPPGTGKTTRGVRWIVQQVLEGADPTGVAFVSFTNAACDVARSRVLAGLREAGIDVLECEMPYCATLHALCKRSLGITDREWLADWKWLKSFAESHGYSLSARRKLADSEDMDTVAAAGGEDAPLLAVWEFGRNRQLTDPSQAYQAYLAYDPDGGYRVPYTRFLKFVQDYEAMKAATFRRDFTDLLLEVVAHPRALPVSVVAIDEAQDMTPLLWAAADVLFANAPVLACLADDDQAIYSYQGADPRLFNDRPANRIVKLEQSYRLPSRVAELAARVINENRNRERKVVLPRPDAVGEVSRVYHPRHLPLLNGETWFLLVRNWAFVSELAAELEAMGIPYRIHGEAQYCPWSNKGPLQAARIIHRLSSPGETISLRELGALLEKTRVETKATPGAWQYGTKTRIRERIEENPSDRISLLDLPALGLTEWGFDRIALRNLEVLAAEISARDLAAYRNAQRTGTWEGVMAGADPLVSMSTIHGRKGDEAQNIGCLEASTPAPARNLASSDRCEEEVRLQYVAITRAKERFFALDGGWMSFGQPWEIDRLEG